MVHGSKGFKKIHNFSMLREYRDRMAECVFFIRIENDFLPRQVILQKTMQDRARLVRTA